MYFKFLTYYVLMLYTQTQKKPASLENQATKQRTKTKSPQSCRLQGTQGLSASRSEHFNCEEKKTNFHHCGQCHSQNRIHHKNHDLLPHHPTNHRRHHHHHHQQHHPHDREITLMPILSTGTLSKKRVSARWAVKH